ncbi:MAG: DUF3043 domain-containing protein, partial [Actinomycetota bacterium]|nr:DUF3043 domain-containing protein [Actinomycetota bacterium]
MRLLPIKLPGRAKAPAEPRVPPEQEPKPTGKGRPTPKRQRAAPPPPPPTTRKEAYARIRERSKGQRVESRKGMLEGDDRYVLPRDRGPVRRLVRDIVDSRRNMGSYFFGVAIVILLASSLPNLDPRIKIAVSYVWLVMIFVLIGDSYLLGRVIRRGVAERFPDDDV